MAVYTIVNADEIAAFIDDFKIFEPLFDAMFLIWPMVINPCDVM